MANTASEPMAAKILFVDDEENILRSLRREFVDTEFETFLASSIDEALKVLERERVDIVVSDYRMPSMDGLEFLGLVRRLYPGTYRVMLSGFVEQHVILRALSSGLASAFIGKPWESEQLHEKIGHLIRSKQLLKSPEVLRMVNAIEDLPSLPTVYSEFTRAVEEERTCEELSGVIRRDIATTALILRVAGSGYYHLGGKGLSLEKALAYIGIRGIRDILLFTALLKHGCRERSQSEWLTRVTKHSIMVNCAVGELHRMKFDKPLPEPYTSVGITHDVGKVIMLAHLPERFNAVTAHMLGHPGAGFYESELALGLAGTTHVEIGAFFLDVWGLPESSVAACLYHHDPEGCNDPSYRDILGLCGAAHMLTDRVEGKTGEENQASSALPAGFEEVGGMDDLIAELKKRQEDDLGAL